MAPVSPAALIFFLASRAGGFTTGQTFVIDGGQTISGS
jgi:NAD(P)-dependent dehydrogenase (short-subunit alcohol dehydrogenase family)